MVFQTISILVGVIYYITSIKNQNKSRQIQIISSSNTSEINWDFLDWEINDYDDFMSKYGPKVNPDGWKWVMFWFNVLEMWGVYVREGILDIRLVCLMSGGTIKESWEKYKVIFEEGRVRYNRPRDWIEAEYLYTRVVDYQAKHPELAT